MGRAQSDVTRAKIASSLKAWAKTDAGRKHYADLGRSLPKPRPRTRDERISYLLSKAWVELGFDARRERVLIEQENRCAVCDLGLWRGKQITLEYDHKNGDRYDDSRDNVWMICPNCHSQTDTWRGRNQKRHNKKSPLTDDQIVQALTEHSTIADALRSLGRVPKGNNYYRAVKLFRERCVVQG